MNSLGRKPGSKPRLLDDATRGISPFDASRERRNPRHFCRESCLTNSISHLLSRHFESLPPISAHSPIHAPPVVLHTASIPLTHSTPWFAPSASHPTPRPRRCAYTAFIDSCSLLQASQSQTRGEAPRISTSTSNLGRPAAASPFVADGDVAASSCLRSSGAPGPRE